MKYFLCFDQFQYIIDDAELKQNTFCAGTSIPVKHSSELQLHDPQKKLVIVVFAWNFWDEIAKKIIFNLKKIGMNTVKIVLPFPMQQLIEIHVQTEERVTVLENPYRILPWPLENKKTKLVLVAELGNYERHIQQFLFHHVGMFDHIFFLKRDSSDQSENIIREIAPSFVSIIESRQELEKKVGIECRNGCWQFHMSVFEYIVHPNLRSLLRDNSVRRDTLFPILFMHIDQKRHKLGFNALETFTTVSSLTFKSHGHGSSNMFFNKIEFNRKLSESRVSRYNIINTTVDGYIARFPKNFEPNDHISTPLWCLNQINHDNIINSYQRAWYKTVQSKVDF